MNLKSSLIIGVTIIIVTVLLFVTSSGCATKEPTVTVNAPSTTNVTQTTSEGTPVNKETVAEEASPAKQTSTENLTLAEEATQAEKETPAITPKTKPEIKIIHPVEETNWQENIGGIAKNIPDEYELWILVYSQEKQEFYPYAKVVPQNDEWVIKPLTIGFKDDYNKKFDIIAVLADKEAQSIFNNYLNTSQENGENIYSQGQYLIPDGAKEYDRITLTRVGMFSDSTTN